MKKAKLIQVNEIVKPGKTSWEYIGVEVERTKEKVALLCVGGSDWDDIRIEEFEVKAVRIKSADRDRVHSSFSMALNETKAYAIHKETELMKARRNLRFHEMKVKEFFGKPLSIEHREEFNF